MVTGPVKRTLVYILARPLIGQEFVSFLAAALEAADGVSAHVITATVVHATFINVFAGLAVGL